MAIVLFWTAVAVIGYTYLVFPVVLLLRARMVARPHAGRDITPTVSMVICAYNEAATIAEKLRNLRGLDYPRDRLDITIASDGSSDETEQIIRACADPAIRLLALPRRGKIATLNAAANAARGEIVVFSDANSLYRTDALRNLLRPFADPEVGAVAGDQRYLKRGSIDAATDGERSYWDIDRWLKIWQSAAGSATSATGAIYAVRRSLLKDVPPGVTDDFVTSTRAVREGYRLVFEPQAVAYEAQPRGASGEFRRKVRVITRGLRGVYVMRTLLNPFRYGFYSLQLLSHKVLRRLMWLPLLAALIVGPLTWSRGAVYQLALLAQLALYGLALVGAALHKHDIGRRKPLALPFFFCLVNAASMLATFRALAGRTIDIWEPPRHDALTAAPLATGAVGSPNAERA